MKVVVCVLLVLLGFLQVNAKQVKVVGDIENHKFLDRQMVYAPAKPNDNVSRSFVFPPYGVLNSHFVITGYKQIDEGLNSPEVEIVSGGIGFKFITLTVTADTGKPLATTFQFYGDKKIIS